MSKKLILLIVCLCLIFPVVMAESVSGSFSYTGLVQQVDARGTDDAGVTTNPYILKVKNIEYDKGLTAIVFFHPTVASFAGGAPSGMSTPVIIRDGGFTEDKQIVFTGTMGYQRIYNFLGIEQPGYTWWNIETENIGTLTGNKQLYVCATYMYAPNYGGALSSAGGYPTQNGGISYSYQSNPANYITGGTWQLTKSLNFINNYTAIKPSGIGITGTIGKTSNGIAYPSKVFVYDGVNQDTIVASEPLINSNDYIFTTSANSIKIGALNSYGIQFNSSVLFPSVPNFSLLVTETNLVSGQTTTGVLSSSSNDLANIKAINYYKTQVGDSEPTYESTSFYESGSTEKTLNYVFRSPNWYGYNRTAGDYTNNKGSLRPEPVSLNFPNGGSYDVGAFVYTGVNLDLTDTPKTRVTVNNSVANAKATLLLFASDATTSQFITPVTYAVKNLVNNSWSNYTSSLPDGSATFTFSKDSGVAVYISATGYQSTSFTTTVTGNNIITTPLTPTNLFIPASNLDYTNLQVTLKYTNDGIQYYPAKNIRVSAETFDPAEILPKQYGDTNTEGVVFFTVLNQSQNHTQTYATVLTAVMANYKTVSKSVIPTGNLYTVQLWTQANQIIIPTNQPTPIPVTTSPTPVQTGIGGVVKNGTAAVCGAPNGNTNIVDIFKSNIACWGVSDRFSQDLAFAALIILFCAFLMSKFGKGIGAIVGAAIGFVISLAANLIPIWVFFALVIIAGLIFGLKLYGSDK